MLPPRIVLCFSGLLLSAGFAASQTYSNGVAALVLLGLLSGALVGAIVAFGLIRLFYPHPHPESPDV